MSWDLSCSDWDQRLQQGRSLVPSLPLHSAEAERAVAVFNKLRLADVPGTPTMAEAAGDWFRDIVRALFGSLDPVTRERAIRELFLLVSKKNSKTTNGALLMLTALLLNQRPNASLIMTAPVQDVAQLAFDAAAGAIALDPVLSRKLHVREHLKTIVHRDTKAELQIMTFDPAVVTGQKPVAVLIDELHVVAKMSKASSAIRQLRGGMLPFPEAFMVFITTQSEEAPAGVFRAELMKARAIRDGKQEGVMLPVLYEFPEEIQRKRELWMDPTNWPMVTPNVGRSITIGRLVEEMRTAESTSEEELRAWASQHLNVEIGLALKSDSWPGAEFWEQQGRSGLTLESLLERCEVVDVGVDGGGLDDLLGLAVVGRDRESREWLAWCHAWAHPSVLERRKAEAPRFRDFEKAGDLTLVKQLGEDIEDLAEIVADIHAHELLDKIGMDPAGIGAIIDALVAAGVPQDKIVGVSQGWRLGGAIKTTERALAEGRLLHCGQALMAWCAGNAKIEQRANSTVVTKQASGTAKVDPIMALFNAVSLIALNPPAQKKKYQMLFAGGRPTGTNQRDPASAGFRR
ncbi:terminase TerL endonuclease subunit [Hydrocarboniphaga effusa]|uniref:terminase TerL endonuclease subunit n=1 Tax=Hydrocarboniphaga effusa TaxID=243629 RepID=UPI003BA879EC